MGRFNISTNNKYIDGYVEYTESNVDTNANTSKVTAKAYIHRNNSWTGEETQTNKVKARFTIGGSYSGDISLNSGGYVKVPNGGAYIEVGSYYATIQHENDGSKKISITYSLSNYSGKTGLTVNSTTQDNISLTEISRGSQPSCITWPETTEDVGTIGNSFVIHMNRKNSNYTHTVEVYWGNKYYVFGNARITSNVSWTMPMEMCEEVHGSMIGQGTIRVHTFNGDTYIGYKDVVFKAHVPEYTLGDAVTTMTLYNSNSTLAGWNVAANGYTKIDWISTFPTPASRYYSNITHAYLCIIEDGNDLTPTKSLCDLTDTTASSGRTEFLNYTPGTYRVKMGIEDSRGKWSNCVLKDPDDNTKPLKLTIYSYTKPKMQGATVFRCNEQGVQQKDGTYIKISCSGVVGESFGGRNGITTKYQSRQVGGTYGGENPIPNTPIGGYSNSLSYEILISVKDTFGESETRTIIVPIGKTDFHLTPNGAGFGRYHDSSKPNTIQSEWNPEFNGYNDSNNNHVPGCVKTNEANVLGYIRHLTTSDDLDDIKDGGVYCLLHNDDASLNRHYPIKLAGTLEVIASGGPVDPETEEYYDMIIQRYTTWNSSNGDFGVYVRTFSGTDSDDWYDWKKIY